MIAAVVAALSSCGDTADESSGNTDKVAQTTTTVSAVGEAPQSSLTTTAADTTQDSVTVDTTAPVDVADVRPPLVNEFVPMVFDHESGVVVALFPTAEDGTEAWTFDVTTEVWTKASAADLWYPPHVVYDPVADLTVATSDMGRTYTYDADTDQWSQRPSIPGVGTDTWISGVGYDQDAAHTVVLVEALNDGTLSAWSFTPSSGAWIGMYLDPRQQPIDRVPTLMTYAPSIARFIVLTGDDDPSSTEQWSHATWTLDADTGTWDKIDVAMPELHFNWDTSWGNQITYVPTTDRVIVFTRGVIAEYDPVTQSWQTFVAPQTSTTDGVGFGPLVRWDPTLVYDSVNERALMYGGTALLKSTTDEHRLVVTDDMWAYDPVSHTWSIVLDATQTSTVGW